MRILAITFAVIILLIVLVLFYLKRHGATTKFVSKQCIQDELNEALKLSETILERLNLSTTEWKFDYSFGTNKKVNALVLIDKLKAMGYSARLRQNNLLFVIEEWQVYGWTANINCSSDSMKKWIEEMYLLGYEYDCLFERWGTFDSVDLIEDAIASGKPFTSFIEDAVKK